MVDIQSATAEIKIGKEKKEERQKLPQGKNIMSTSATQGGHNHPRVSYGSGCWPVDLKYTYPINVSFAVIRVANIMLSRH